MKPFAILRVARLGFLISSYKYIVAQNTKKNKGDLLTPDDKEENDAALYRL